jgi:hypothetical protein
LERGPGEICAAARGTPSRHDAAATSKRTAQRFSPKTIWRILWTPGALLRTLSSALPLLNYRGLAGLPADRLHPDHIL